MQTRYYLSDEGWLAYVDRSATPEFWDRQWQLGAAEAEASGATTRSFVSDITQKYLDPANRSRILEGGCGRGQHVAALTSQGYEAIGLDFAEKTVDSLRKFSPHLDIRFGDVRDLPFDDESFDAYWSLGVIEHFWEGYEQIAKEMLRVVRPGGYLFITFPSMSPLRRLLVRIGCFESMKRDVKPEGFYQFALESRHVAAWFQQRGCKLVSGQRLAGIKGLKDDVPFLRPALRIVYEYRGRNYLFRKIKALLERALRPFFGHSSLVVLQLPKQTWPRQART